MSARDKVDDLLTKMGDDYEMIAERAWKSGDQELIQYLMRIGITKIASAKRRKTRQFIKENVIKTEFMEDRPLGKVKVRLTDNFKAKHLHRTVSNIMTAWRIGGLELGKCTKDKLLAQAKAERSSSKGHLENAVWYERLAAPMNERQTVEAYWRDAKAIVFIREEALTDTVAGNNTSNILQIENRTGA